MTSSHDIPSFEGFDDATREAVHALAFRWHDTPSRPRIAPEILAAWRGVVEAATTDRRLPLFIRRAPAGTHMTHQTSGRTILFVDNSPAHWCFSSALCGRCPTPDDILDALASGRFPIAMVPKDTTLYSGALQKMDAPSLNNRGWKVCHIAPVGLKKRPELSDEDTLVTYTRRLLDPNNMFLVPKVYGGLGEVPEFLNVFKEAAL